MMVDDGPKQIRFRTRRTQRLEKRHVAIVERRQRAGQSRLLPAARFLYFPSNVIGSEDSGRVLLIYVQEQLIRTLLV